ATRRSAEPVTPAAPHAAKPGPHGDESAARRAYDDDSIWDQLSGAARTRLEAIYGKRSEKLSSRSESDQQVSTPPDETEPSVPRVGDGQIGGSSEAGAHDEALSAITDTLVNDTAADTTAQDTQSDTAIVLGSGSTVVALFDDSGSNVGGASKFD